MSDYTEDLYLLKEHLNRHTFYPGHTSHIEIKHGCSENFRESLAAFTIPSDTSRILKSRNLDDEMFIFQPYKGTHIVTIHYRERPTKTYRAAAITTYIQQIPPPTLQALHNLKKRRRHFQYLA